MRIRTGWRAGEKRYWRALEGVPVRAGRTRPSSRFRFGRGENVAAGEDEWDRRALNGRRLRVALLATVARRSADRPRLSKVKRLLLNASYDAGSGRPGETDWVSRPWRDRDGGRTMWRAGCRRRCRVSENSDLRVMVHPSLPDRPGRLRLRPPRTCGRRSRAGSGRAGSPGEDARYWLPISHHTISRLCSYARRPIDARSRDRPAARMNERPGSRERQARRFGRGPEIAFQPYA